MLMFSPCRHPALRTRMLRPGPGPDLEIDPASGRPGLRFPELGMEEAWGGLQDSLSLGLSFLIWEVGALM